MSETLLMLRLEHHQMGRVVDALEHRLSSACRTAALSIRAIETMLAYCLTYPDRCHHPKENLIYDRLCLRDPAAAEEIGDLLEEHGQLASMVRLMASLAAEAALAPDRSGAGLAEVGQHFVALYRRHMAREEAEFFPVAVRALTDADWQELDSRVFDGPDPLFSEPVDRQFQALRAEILRA